MMNFVRGTRVLRSLAGLLLYGLLSSAVVAESGATPLDHFFIGLSTFTARFDQTITDAKGVVTQNASGKVTIQRPGKFSWDYTTPYEQLVLGDGQHLWTYDADLEQATIKPQGDALAGTPALLLSAREQPQDLFDVKVIAARDGEAWFELTPKSQDGLADTQFSQLRLGFANDVLVAMELVDAFEQTTLIRFNDLRRNGHVETGLFNFTPKAGVDVIGEIPNESAR